jgi:hypothetical protein
VFEDAAPFLVDRTAPEEVVKNNTIVLEAFCRLWGKNNPLFQMFWQFLLFLQIPDNNHLLTIEFPAFFVFII